MTLALLLYSAANRLNNNGHKQHSYRKVRLENVKAKINEMLHEPRSEKSTKNSYFR
jgi:hypothetical protein